MLVEETGSQFLGFVSPAEGFAKVIKSVILNFFAEDKVETPNSKGIGYDGTK